MNIPFNFRAQIEGIPGGTWVAETIKTVINAVSAAWIVQHNDDGSHGTITFDDAIGPSVTTVTGSPEGVVAAKQGSLRLRKDGSTSTTLYAKTSGNGPTGWTALGSGSGSGTVTNTGTLTNHAVIVGTGGVDVAALASLGSAGDVLTSNGAGADPSFQVASSVFLQSFTNPTLTSFSWINQGGATLTTGSNYYFLNAPTSATANVRIQKKSAPATPYTITIAIYPLMANASYQGVGVCWRESSSGKLITWGPDLSSTNSALSEGKWASPTSFTANYVSFYGNWIGASVLFLRISDDGANRVCSHSVDGVNYRIAHSVGRTDFITADEVGWYSNGQSSAWETGVTLMSWKET